MSPVEQLALLVTTLTRIFVTIVLAALLFLAITVGGALVDAPAFVLVIVGVVAMFGVVYGVNALNLRPMRLRALRVLRDEPGKVAYIVGIDKAMRSRGGSAHIALADGEGRMIGHLRLRGANVYEQAMQLASQCAPDAKTAMVTDPSALRPMVALVAEGVRNAS